MNIRRVLFLVLLPVVAPRAGTAQIGRLIDKAKDAMQQKKDAAADSAALALINAIRCAISDSDCIRRAKEAGKNVQVVDAKGKPVSSADSAKAVGSAGGVAVAGGASSGSTGVASAPPGAGVWLNYDFIPGDRVIWSEDFSGDDVGDFPRRVKLVGGNFEVVDIKGKKYLRTTTGGTIRVILPEKLPDRFTVEAHYFGPQGGNPLRFTTSRDGSSWGCYQNSGFVHAADNTASEAALEAYPETAFTDCRFTIDTRYIKAYVNQKRVANHPTADVERGTELFIDIPSHDDGSLLTDIRIAAGGKKLYDLLNANGRVATQGIFFDTGSDRIRGESTPTLKEIGDMLTQHADLKLTIEGHTDNVGGDASNMTLSDKRAAAVKAYLVSTYHVDAARLQTKGLGASKPVAPNTTPEGRQNNRRVELVKLP